MGMTASVLLAGCTSVASDPPPSTADQMPASSASAQCTPQTATIFWSAARTLDPVAVGVYILDFVAAGETTTTTPIDFDTETSIGSGDGLNMLTDFDRDEREAWEDALLADLQRTGQVARDFGAPTKLPDTAAITMTAEAAGTWVQVMSQDKVAVAFEIQCDGAAASDTVTGSVVAFEPAHVYSAIYDCATVSDPVTDESTLARSYCPAATSTSQSTRESG